LRNCPPWEKRGMSNRGSGLKNPVLAGGPAHSQSKLTVIDYLKGPPDVCTRRIPFLPCIGCNSCAGAPKAPNAPTARRAAFRIDAHALSAHFAPCQACSTAAVAHTVVWPAVLQNPTARISRNRIIRMGEKNLTAYDRNRLPRQDQGRRKYQKTQTTTSTHSAILGLRQCDSSLGLSLPPPARQGRGTGMQMVGCGFSFKGSGEIIAASAHHDVFYAGRCSPPDTRRDRLSGKKHQWPRRSTPCLLPIDLL